MTMWNTCCCDPVGCQISKTEWDATRANLFEFSNMVASASTVLTKITGDGSTIGYQDYNKKPPGSWPTITTVPQATCLQVATSIAWRPSPGDLFTSCYLVGQTYDDVSIVPSGQNYKWCGSIDFSVRYLEQRYNASTSATGILGFLTDAGSVPPVGPYSDFERVSLWLAARQNGVVYIKRWIDDSPLDSVGHKTNFAIEGRTGKVYDKSTYPPVNASLVPGDWVRIGSLLSTAFMNTPKQGVYTGPVVDAHAWIKPAAVDGPGKYNGPYVSSVLPSGDLDWCAGASPIYFGWAMLCEGRQVSNSGPPAYHVDTMLKQTIRIDRICLTIKEDPTPACPCFDTCFEFSWTGGSVTDGSGTTSTTSAAYFLPRYVATDGTSLWWQYFYLLGYNHPDWCVFGDDRRTVNSATNTSTILFVDKATGRALLSVKAGPSASAPDSLKVWYASVNFDQRGGDFVRVNCSDTGALQAIGRGRSPTDWTVAADLSDPGQFDQRSTAGIVADSMPTALTLSAIRCDGSSATVTTAAGSCVGSCQYGTELVSPGVWRWKYLADPTVNPCSSGCRCYEAVYLPSRYGVPAASTDRLVLNCVPRSNNAPTGTPAVVSMARNTRYVFSVSDWGFTDPFDSPADSLLAVIITTLPGRGSLKLSGKLLTPGQVIAVADLVAGNLVFTPAAGEFMADYAVFSFQVIDNGGTARGGIDTDPLPKSFVINVT